VPESTGCQGDGPERPARAAAAPVAERCHRSTRLKSPPIAGMVHTTTSDISRSDARLRSLRLPAVDWSCGAAKAVPTLCRGSRESTDAQRSPGLRVLVKAAGDAGSQAAQPALVHAQARCAGPEADSDGLGRQAADPWPPKLGVNQGLLPWVLGCGNHTARGQQSLRVPIGQTDTQVRDLGRAGGNALKQTSLWLQYVISEALACHTSSCIHRAPRRVRAPEKRAGACGSAARSDSGVIRIAAPPGKKIKILIVRARFAMGVAFADTNTNAASLDRPGGSQAGQRRARERVEIESQAVALLRQFARAGQAGRCAIGITAA